MATPQSVGKSVAASPCRNLLLIGVDHRSTPLAMRERLAYNPDDRDELLSRLRQRPEILEASLLSTCNRTELYVRASEPGSAFRPAFDTAFLERAPEIESEGRFFLKRDDDVARHLLEVACGLQSMVLGEPEILGQVKQGVGRAQDERLGGVVLGQLFQAAVATGGQARQETAIGAGAVSFGYAVVELARTIFSRLEDTQVLLIGAGETARLTAQSLVERGVRRLWIANRSRARAEELCSRFEQAEALAFERRTEVLGEADLVVASTSANEPVLEKEPIERAMIGRRGRPLLAVDLGVPRNIDPTVGQIANVFLQDIDALEGLINRNLKRRRAEVSRVQKIIERALDRFTAWADSLAAEPLLQALAEHADTLRMQEIEPLRDRLTPEAFAEVERAANVLVRKLLHNPRLFLRGKVGDPLPHHAVVRRIFGLAPDSEDE